MSWVRSYPSSVFVVYTRCAQCPFIMYLPDISNETSGLAPVTNIGMADPNGNSPISHESAASGLMDPLWTLTPTTAFARNVVLLSVAAVILSRYLWRSRIEARKPTTQYSTSRPHIMPPVEKTPESLNFVETRRTLNGSSVFTLEILILLVGVFIWARL